MTGRSRREEALAEQARRQNQIEALEKQIAERSSSTLMGYLDEWNSIDELQRPDEKMDELMLQKV